MSDDKTEWPTKARIARLRNEGLIIYSSFLTRALLLIVILIISVFFAHSLAGLYSTTSEVINEMAKPAAKLTLMVPLVKFGLEWLMAFTITALVAVLLTVLVQSRFLFTFSLVSFQPSRAAAFLKFNLITTILRLFIKMLIWSVCLLVGVTIVWWYAYDLLVLFNLERVEWPKLLSNFTYHLVLGVGSGVIILGLIAYGWARIVFMQNNRMSRREADNESE